MTILPCFFVKMHGSPYWFHMTILWWMDMFSYYSCEVEHGSLFQMAPGKGNSKFSGSMLNFGGCIDGGLAGGFIYIYLCILLAPIRWEMIQFD